VALQDGNWKQESEQRGYTVTTREVEKANWVLEESDRREIEGFCGPNRWRLSDRGREKDHEALRIS
jgi:hypothetical protein